MSAFDLAGDHDSASLIDNARANPLDLSQSVGFFTGMGTGLATGVGRLLADTQRTTGLALGAVAGSFDMLTGDALKAQDKVFEHIVTPADKLSRHLAPKPEEIGMAGRSASAARSENRNSRPAACALNVATLPRITRA